MTALTGISLGLSGQYLLHLVSKGDLQLQLFVKKCSWLNLPRDLEWLNKSQKWWLRKEVSVRWSVLTTGIYRYWQFLKYTNQMLSTWYYLYLFCYLAVHKLALSSLTAISPQCPQASLCLEKRTSNTIISNNFSNHVQLLNHTSLESITKWLWLRCSEFFQ